MAVVWMSQEEKWLTSDRSRGRPRGCWFQGWRSIEHRLARVMSGATIEESMNIEERFDSIKLDQSINSGTGRICKTLHEC